MRIRVGYTSVLTTGRTVTADRIAADRMYADDGEGFKPVRPVRVVVPSAGIAPISIGAEFSHYALVCAGAFECADVVIAKATMNGAPPGSAVDISGDGYGKFAIALSQGGIVLAVDIVNQSVNKHPFCMASIVVPSDGVFDLHVLATYPQTSDGRPPTYSEIVRVWGCL